MFREKLKRVRKNNRAIAIGLLVLAIIVAFRLVYPDIVFWRLNNQANEYVRHNDFEKARALYIQAEKINTRLRYIAENNRATYAYRTHAYDDASTLFTQAVHDGCHLVSTASTTGGTVASGGANVNDDHCGVIAYNLANTQYRIGEELLATSTVSVTATSSISTSTIAPETRNRWLSAIGLYQSDLSVRPEDAEAKENIDFILQKLNASSTKADESSKQSPSGTNENKNNRNASSSKNGTEKAAENQKQNDASSQNDKNEQRTANDKAGNDEKATAQATSQSADGQGQDGTQLSDEASKQLDARMNNLEQKSRKLQGYFTRNPKAAPPKNDNNPFNDPFFQSFFGDNFFGNNAFPNFNEQSNSSVDKDW